MHRYPLSSIQAAKKPVGMNRETALTPATRIAQAFPTAGKSQVTVIRAGYTYAPKVVKGSTGDAWKNAKRIDPVLLISYLQLSMLKENKAMTVGAINLISIKNLKKC